MENIKTTKGSILIAHIADTHLRDTQYATSQRGVDFFKAFMRAIEAISNHDSKEKIDLIVCAGDIFDVSRPSAKVIGQLIKVDAVLRRLNMRMLCVTGNHDHSNPTWLSTLFQEGGDHDGYGIIPIDGETYHRGGFTISGIAPYTATAFTNKKAEIDAAAEVSDVLVYHGFVTGIVPVFTGDKNVLSVESLPTSKRLKAILLGDIHIQGYVTPSKPTGGTTLIGYPGSLEMCSASEPLDKSVPLIRVSADKAEVVGNIPLTIRPFISRKVRTAEELESLIADVTLVADQHPVVPVEFARELPQTVSRLHAILDAQRAVIRCYPLPPEKTFTVRAATGEDEDELGMDHFISRRFADNDALSSVATALLIRGELDAANIITDFIEARYAANDLRGENEN